MTPREEEPRDVDESAFEAQGLPGTADDEAYPAAPDVDGFQPPGDEPIAVEEYGLTAEETRRGEPLSDRLTRERPDDPAQAHPRGGTDSLDIDAAPAADADAEDDGVVGRIVQPDQGVRGDEDAEMLGEESDDVAGLSAEEAALHIDPRS